MAAFYIQAKAGKLKPWSEISEKFSGAAPKAPLPWKDQQAERMRQMATFQKHQTQRHIPPRKKHGR